MPTVDADTPEKPHAGEFKFNADFSSDSCPSKEFRVFTDQSKVHNTSAIRGPGVPEENLNHETHTVHISGTQEDQGYETAASVQDRGMAECQALLHVLQNTPSEHNIIIISASPYLCTSLFTNLAHHESQGWIRTKNKDALQAIIATLCS